MTAVIDAPTQQTKRERSARARQRVADAKYVTPLIEWVARLNRFVVSTRHIAALTAHEHFNVMTALKQALALYPEYVEHYWNDFYTGKNGRLCEYAYLDEPLVVLVLDRMRPIKGVKPLGEVRNQFRDLFKAIRDEQKPADPAPDDDITPPERERPDLFDKALPVIDTPANSWIINRIVHKLTKRPDLPEVLRNDLNAWNDDRCERLRRDVRKRGGGQDEIEQIYALRKPE